MDILTEDTFVNTELFEQERAINQLKSEGNPWPDTFQIRERMAANAAARPARLAQAKAKAEAHTREKAATETQPQPTARKRGRPPKNPLWLADLADSYAQGIPMLRALRKMGMGDLTKAERKNIYRWKRFRQLVESYHGKYGTR